MEFSFECFEKYNSIKHLHSVSVSIETIKYNESTFQEWKIIWNISSFKSIHVKFDAKNVVFCYCFGC